MDPIVRSIHDTIVISRIDTVFVKSNDVADMLSRVDDFYDHAWGRLMYFVVAIGAIGGLIVPAYINSSLRKTFKNETDKLEAAVGKTIAEAKSEITQQIMAEQAAMEEQITEEFEEEKAINRAQFETIRIGAAGGSLFVQSKGFFDKGAFEMAFVGYLKAARHLIKGNDRHNLEKSIFIARSCIKHLNKEAMGRTEYLRRWETELARLRLQIEASEEYLYLLHPVDKIWSLMESIPDTQAERK